jgi:hypothetical protein
VRISLVCSRGLLPIGNKTGSETCAKGVASGRESPTALRTCRDRFEREPLPCSQWFRGFYFGTQNR